MRFELRACRRTFGQGCIDEELSIETVSLLLGHATSKTTGSYYCRKRQDVAIREAQALWNSPRPQLTKSAKIASKKSGIWMGIGKCGRRDSNPSFKLGKLK
jgi:hypothetical protein